MNRMVAFVPGMMLMFLVVSCSKGKESVAITQYRDYVATLDSNDYKTLWPAVVKYQQLFKKTKRGTSDSGVVILYRYYEKMVHTLSNQTVAEDSVYLPLTDSLAKLTDKQLKLSNSLKRNGIAVRLYEGSGVELYWNRDSLAQWVYSYVTPTMKRFLVQMNKDSKDPLFAAAAFRVKPNVMIDRVLWWDRFHKEYPAFMMEQEVAWHREILYHTLFVGPDDARVRDKRTGEFNEYYQRAYVYLQKAYPHSEANKLVQPYFEAMQKGDSTKADAIMQDYHKQKIVVEPVW